MHASGDGRQTRLSLIGRLQQGGDEAAWSDFCAVYGPLVYRYLRGRGLQDADAANVAQEVLLDVVRGLHNYEQERGRFRGWLGKIARNQLGRFWARRARQERGVGGEDGDAALDQVAGEVDPEWIDEYNAHLSEVALERVKARCEPTTWRAFELVCCENRLEQEAANLLGVSVNKIYVAKCRVQKRLKEELRILMDEEPDFLPGGGSP